jgi:hypothetical protein
MQNTGHAVVQLVEALRHKPEVPILVGVTRNVP